MLQAYDYDPYGNTQQVSGSKPTDMRYAGMYLHQPSGLYLTHYRFYDPKTTRWLNRDPIGYAGGLNLYGYVGNNPVNYVDPAGLNPGFYWAGVGISYAVNAGLAYIERAIAVNGVRIATASAIAGEVGMGLAGASSSGSPLVAGKICSGTGEYVRVGRWMSQREYSAMLATGRVIESKLEGVTSVTLPPNPIGYTGAKVGSVFIEFDVPDSVVRAVGGGWAKIWGPNSMWAGKLGITEMPSATNIERIR